MTKFDTLHAIAAPLPQANIDTDVIMPKQFLKRIDRAGLAEGVFHDLRFGALGLNADFILNQSPYDAAKILICGDNFGCGSSREYAVWGLMQLGIRAIIAPSFAGIFFGNCEKNGLLAITLPELVVNDLIALAQCPDTAHFTINLPNQIIVDSAGLSVPFDIGASRKAALISGADHVETSLKEKNKILEFEQMQKYSKPWLWQGRPTGMSQVLAATRPETSN